MEIVFLLSHRPDPRMYLRMMALKQEHSIKVVFWDRCLNTKSPYSIPVGVKEHSIAIPAPQGQWVRRIIPLLKFWRKSLGTLRHIRPGVIHCGNLDMLSIAHSYRRLVDPDVKLVYEIADLPKVIYNTSQDLKSRTLSTLFHTIEKALCKSIALLVITSPYFWDDYYSSFIPKSKVLFLANAPEQGLFSHYSKARHDDFTVGFVGRIRYPNQIRMLVDASENIEGVKVLLAGSGVSYGEIRDYCFGKEHVLFFGPYDYRKDIVSLYSEIDCVYSVYDTTYDNVRVALPNKLYEAIACELPIIVADNTALARFVIEHGIGFAVSDRDALGLRNLIVKLISQPQLLDETRVRLRKLKSSYSAETGCDMLRQSYRRLGIPET